MHTWSVSTGLIAKRFLVLNRYIFKTLNHLRQLTHDWIHQYNKERPHDSLDDMILWEYSEKYRMSETLVQTVPKKGKVTKVSPYNSSTDAIKHTLHGDLEIRLVIYTSLLENWLEFQPVLVTEHEAGHNRFLLVLCKNCNNTNL
ncbi:hypothetical protein CI610_01383 [invertebrate metagenome]|uniref:Integrase catalytic domain-containing protein n=1 Tax=invertebrate metagenome TaxID=1711999 RepID=A0A2H9T8U4_9ZZZZ